MSKKLGYFILSCILILGLILSGCGGSPSGSSNNQTAIVPAPPRGATGTIALGTSVAVTSAQVPAGGGAITVNDPASPLNGMALTVPSGAYSNAQKFSISYAPITSHTFGEAFKPITPLITVDNSGAFANELIELKVPVKVTPGCFAMGFIYDPKTQTLEGLPTVKQDADSITVATRHFCDLTISEITDSMLKSEINSDFLPGVNDWQFTNWGSYIAPRGHCTGQSMTAMWYYITQPEGKDTGLFERYDNNGREPMTPDFWQDDSLGYRFASTVWADMDWNSWGRKLTEGLLSKSDEITWKLFAYSMQVTGQPQMVEVWDTVKGGGHALVVYSIVDKQLYVADPNFPASTERVIRYAGGKFSPYNSAENTEDVRAGNTKMFDQITYCAKSSLVDWDSLSSRWQEFKNGTIGNDKFPSYKLAWKDDKNSISEFKDSITTTKDRLVLGVLGTVGGGAQMGVKAFRNGQELTADDQGSYELLPGNNKLGIGIFGNLDGDWKYIDFKYINVAYEPPTPTTSAPPSVKGDHPVIQSITGPTDLSQLQAGGTVTFTVKITGGTPPYKETWYANMQQISAGQDLETVEVPVNRLRFNGESWTIFLMVEDSTGEQAAWVDSSGMSHPEFVWGIMRSGQVITEPSFPYKSFGSK